MAGHLSLIHYTIKSDRVKRGDITISQIADQLDKTTLKVHELEEDVEWFLNGMDQVIDHELEVDVEWFLNWIHQVFDQ